MIWKHEKGRRRVKVTKRQILFENNAFYLKTNKFSEKMSKRYIFPQQYGERKKAKLDVTVSDHNFPVSQNNGTGKGIWFIYFLSDFVSLIYYL